jgi:integrase
VHLWRFIHIFFHSGSRTTEILRVQGEHVDLKRQKVKYLVLKGQEYQWVERTIKNVALSLWQQAMEGCGPQDYVFSKGLKPGAKPIRAEQISRRWRTHIKKKLGISCDFYSLKHLNTDQTSALLGLKEASIHNSHKSTGITMTYAVTEKERIHQKIKEIDNQFGK